MLGISVALSIGTTTADSEGAIATLDEYFVDDSFAGNYYSNDGTTDRYHWRDAT